MDPAAAADRARRRRPDLSQHHDRPVDRVRSADAPVSIAAKPGDAVLHPRPRRRDGQPAVERCRRRGRRRRDDGFADPVEPVRRRQHADRDVPPRLALDAGFAGDPAAVHLPDPSGRREKRRQRGVAHLSTIVEETLGVSGAQLIKIFGRDDYEIGRFSGVSDDYRRIRIRESMVGRWFFMTIQTFWAAAPAVVWLVGGHEVISGRFTLGYIIAFTAYQNRLFVPINQLLSVHIDVQSALALFERIFEYLDLPPDVVERADALTLDAPLGNLRFADVRFSYRADLPVLHGVGFHAPEGTMTALVGPSGAGKSTIAALVSRLYDPDAGEVSLDGLDLRDLTLVSVAGAVGVVSQDTFLFHATVRENLLYAKPDASEDEMIAATKAAQIHDFISSLPEQYDTVVGERGYRLSGGEKQRVSIARAILKDPKVLVLDEATSALDTR
ncbi:MAG: ABC transporter ATP-binding protein, partial [Actinobacteria bacterium]